MLLTIFGESVRNFGCVFRPPKSTHHPHKIDNQHRECKTGGGAYFAFFLGSEDSHTTPPKIPPDEEAECTKIARFSAVAAAIFTAPGKIARLFEASRCAISSAKKIASEPRFFFCDENW